MTIAELYSSALRMMPRVPFSQLSRELEVLRRATGSIVLFPSGVPENVSRDSWTATQRLRI
jgi:hypothetical protein